MESIRSAGKQRRNGHKPKLPLEGSVIGNQGSF
jgi:hypothetical protein